MKFSIVLFILSFSIVHHAQTILNGDFENNFASFDEINLTDNSFNTLMPDCFSFGNQSNLDIITSSNYSGGPQNGSWYVALTGGETDMLSLKLSEPLVEGQIYSISFYDKKDMEFIAREIEIGISYQQNDFGEKVYTSPTPPSEGTWMQRSFSFVAPINGAFVTIKCLGDIDTWVQVDNFKINQHIATNEDVLEDLAVAPNPTYGSVLIGPISKDIRVEVFDIYGRLLVNERNNGHILIHFDRKPGLYFISFRKGNSKKAVKLVVL